MTALFHLAIAVDDLEAARHFYGEVIGCPQGREDPGHWIDFDFHGHQLVVHKAEGAGVTARNDVDGDSVPVPHFGLVLDWAEWETLADRFRAHAIGFLIEPHVRFPGKVGEQATMFLYDPAGNALEFKAMRNPDYLFAT